jgi:hypothetical protein
MQGSGNTTFTTTPTFTTTFQLSNLTTSQQIQLTLRAYEPASKTAFF